MMSPSHMPSHDADVRCHCGRLLARRTAAGIELKCRRCGRHVELRLDDLSAEAAPVEPWRRD